MIIHRTYSVDGTKTIHIPCAPIKDYHRLVWGGAHLHPNRLSIEGLISLGRRIEVIPKESHAHS